jgi:hypothetical protein
LHERNRTTNGLQCRKEASMLVAGLSRDFAGHVLHRWPDEHVQVIGRAPDGGIVAVPSDAAGRALDGATPARLDLARFPTFRRVVEARDQAAPRDTGATRA